MLRITPTIFLLALAFPLGLLGQSKQEILFDSLIHEIALRDDQLVSMEMPAEKVATQREIIRLYKEAIQVKPEIQFRFLLISRTLDAKFLLSWYLLNDNQAFEAQVEAEEVMRYHSVDYDISWISVNLALALLYQGKWEETKATIEKWKGETLGADQYWSTVFLADLEELETVLGLHPDAAKARVLLSIGKQ